MIKPESPWVLRKVLLAIPLSASLIAFAQPFLPPQALAQYGSTTPVHCHSLGTQDEIPPDKLPVPQKLPGIGNVHIKITASPEAQLWFDQGLNLYHDFWEYESLRAFQQGVRVDPQCAMCYWGIYQAEIFRHSSSKHYANATLAKAVSLKGHASKAERLYIEASAAHEAEEKDKKDSAKEGDSREVQILRKLVKHSPKDTQARIFLAWTLMDGYDDDGTPREGTKETLTILQGVLKDEPENSAANHYWIPSKRVRSRNKRCTAPRSWDASRLLRATWCTCPDTFFFAPATTRERNSHSRPRRKPMNNTCSRNKCKWTMIGTTSTT
jgi:hypothetical protein